MMVIVLAYELWVLALSFSARTLWKCEASSPVAPFVLKTSGLKLPFSVSRARSLYSVILQVS